MYVCGVLAVALFITLFQILLSNTNLLLRKAAVSCLRQLLQREAKEVREHAQTLVPQSIMLDRGKDAILTETGLEGALFAMLDVETDTLLRQHIKVYQLHQITSFVPGSTHESRTSDRNRISQLLAVDL